MVASLKNFNPPLHFTLLMDFWWKTDWKTAARCSFVFKRFDEATNLHSFYFDDEILV